MPKGSITLTIEGMTCAHCATTVTGVLKNNGAECSIVDFSTGKVTFYLSENSKLEKIKEDITKAGYKVIESKNVLDYNYGYGISLVEKRLLFTLPFTTILFFSHMFLSHDFFLNMPYIQLLLCIPVFIVGNIHFGKSAWNSLKTAMPNMNVLIIMGAGAAFIYSVTGMIIYYGSHEIHNYLFFETAATIITIVLLGNVMEQRSFRKTTDAIRELSKLQTQYAKKVVMQDGKEIIHEIAVEGIAAGDILQVNEGDKIPADGSVTTGNALMDESMITGEPLPVEKKPGDKVIGGTIVVSGNMRLQAEKIGKETILSGIIEMVMRAQQSKPSIQRLGDKVSAVFVPVVIGISIITFLLCYFVFDVSIQKSLLNSVAVLVVSCPCAMGLATPTAVMVGVGRAARNGILIKGGNTLEEFARIKKIVFDKTGTITTGKFWIRSIYATNKASEKEVESVLFWLEQNSSHPIAKSVVEYLNPKNIVPISFSEIKEIKGVGMEAKTTDGYVYKVGSFRMAGQFTKDTHSLYVFKNEQLIGYADIEDEVKANAKEIISFFKTQQITPVLLSGDHKKRCQEIAVLTGIEEVHSEQLPEQKLYLISELSKKEKIAMVGDGINDAPALAKASVGISVGNATQVAIQSAQIILLNEKDLSQLKTAYLISKHTFLTIKQNLFWAFFYNIVAIPIAAAGFLSPMIAALAMAFSDVIVIGNSIRLQTKSFN